MRAAIYARLSSDRDGTQKKVTEQEADCRAIATARGWTVTDVLVDNDTSAWSGVRRPGFDQLLELLRDRAVDAVIVWHPDRLMRQPRDLEALLDLSQKRGVQLASTGSGRDLGNPDDVFILRIEVAHACRSSDDTSRRVQRGHRGAAERGTPGGGGIRPYGYEPDRMTVRDDERLVVQEAAARLLAGEPLRSVALDLDARGIPTVRGGRWNPTTLRIALTRPRVAGLREHKGEIIGPAAWPALLPLDDWRALRELTSARRVGPARPVVYWLTGTARCGRDDCGHHLTGKPGSDKGRRYVCDPARGGCGRLVRHAGYLEDYVGKLIVAWAMVPGRREQLVAPVQDRTAPEDVQAAKDRERLVELARRWGEGVMSTEEYDAARAPVDARMRSWRRGSSAPARRLGLLAGNDLGQAWKASTPEQKKTAARTLFTAIRVLPRPDGSPSSVFDPSLVDPRWVSL